LQAAEAAIRIERASLAQQKANQCTQVKGLSEAKAEIGRLLQEVTSLKHENEQLTVTQPAHIAEREESEILCQQIEKLKFDNTQLLSELQNTHRAAEEGLKEAVKWQRAAEVQYVSKSTLLYLTYPANWAVLLCMPVFLNNVCNALRLALREAGQSEMLLIFSLIVAVYSHRSCS
jgi:hypothetical protein